MKMQIPRVSVALLLYCQFNYVLGKMSGNVQPIKNRKLNCDKLLKTIENTWLANCGHLCEYHADCQSFSFSQKKRRCELYSINSASAGTDDIIEEDGVILIDMEKWPQSYCSTKGAKLAEPMTPCENAFLKKTLLQTATDAEGGYWWLGLTDKAVEGEWVWSSDGSRPSYTDWHGAEGGYGDCVDLTRTFCYKWKASGCGTKSYAICEMI